MKFLPLVLCPLIGSATAEILTYNNRPQGSQEKPLLMRTFMPDPGLGDTVLGRHHHGYKSPKYNPKIGKDVKGEYLPDTGLPAAIGVNYGPQLSYCWDTVECRLLYAWKDGFLDMTPYWGDPQRGNRVSFGYVPELVGTMIYQASGKHPLTINGTSISDMDQPLKFRGYSIEKNHYQFLYQIGEHRIATMVSKAAGEMDVQVQFKLLTDSGKLQYRDDKNKVETKTISPKEIEVTITGTKLKTYRGSENKKLLASGVNAASGEKVFKAMGCIMCHSVDGSKSHGPSLLGIHGSTRKIKGVNVIADDAYILESIRDPNAKIVSGYPENYMPPYQLEDKQRDALLLYIKSLNKN
ncbi:hypothetical protein NT6N_23030 [Oceaniferula spumae]|uniref:Cytochrome c domain-containing protein n=1 Tax=Oceaniferula spumae TaxID=2979115 RepID=A0AAT9FMT5_9BACT